MDRILSIFVVNGAEDGAKN